MRELLKSMFSFSWSMSLFGMKTMADAMRSGQETAAGLDAVAGAAKDQLGTGLETLYAAGEKVQEQIVDQAFAAVPGMPGCGCGCGGASDCGCGGGSKPPDAGRLDASRFVVLGEGLAAGMGHFSLEAHGQTTSFPALTAMSLQAPFEQPLIEPPGLGDVISFAPQDPVVPNVQQTTVRAPAPQSNDLGNLSVPGFTVHDALHARPLPPIVDRKNNKQTLTNFILGLPDLTHSPRPGKTMLEYARSRRPTLALVCLGYQEAVEAAVAGQASGALTDISEFLPDYTEILRALAGASVLAATVPDPIDTAYFSKRVSAAAILKTTPEFLEEHYGVQSDDLVTLPGLYEMGFQMMNHEVGPLEQSPTLSAAAAAEISQGVVRLNAAISQAASDNGAVVFDLHGILREVAQNGLVIVKPLTTDYLGGLYLLNGFYPGPTLNSVIASKLVEQINLVFGESFFEPSITAIAANDANTLAQVAPGPPSTDAFLKPLKPAPLPPLPPQTIWPIKTTYPALQPGKEGCPDVVGIPAGGLSNPMQPIQLPEGLEQTLEIRPEGSSVGDALRAVDCPNDKSFLPGFPPFGTCPNVFFGGHAVVTSRLQGKIHVKFSPPDEKGFAKFEITHPGGLLGENAVLQAPQMFKMGAQLNIVEDIPEYKSTGVVDTNTGIVTNFHYNVRNFNTAIAALFGVNPNLPPVGLTFPGAPNGGSTWLRFDPRDDGKLDVTLAGNLFLPLGLELGGEPVRFPLPFSTPDLQCASIVARGLTLHPRVHVTTKPPAAPDQPLVPQDIPFNSVREYTCFTHNTSFGDNFELNNPALGTTTGQSLLTGRVRVQFGPRTGDTVAVVFLSLPPGGLLDQQPVPPPFLPPGTARSLTGFNVTTRFTEAVYPQFGLANPDDPFNLGVGVLDLKTGKILGQLLFRGYVVQNLFSELIQVEPCTPADSFLFQGPASFERGTGGETVLRFEGNVFLPYPPGFKFPSPTPGGQPGLVIGPNSRLDPFRWVQATEQPQSYRGTLTGGASHVMSANGQRFSYRYSIPCAPGEAQNASFEYTNQAECGTFVMTSLTWVDCGNARGTSGDPNTVTFSGFGTWSLDKSGGLHQVSVQVSTAENAPYVGIQVDGGVTSNADTKPKNINETRP